MKKLSHTLPTVFFLLILSTTVIGCSAVKKTTEPFKSKQRVNLAPLVEQLTSLVGDMQFGLRQKEPVYIRPFIDTQEVKELKEQFILFRKNTANVLAYTARVITLAQSNKSQTERVEALVDFIYDLRPAIDPQTQVEFTMSDEQIQEILEKTREQETLLDALKTIQPIATEVEVFMRKSVDELDRMVERADQSIRDRILAQHQEEINYLWTIKSRRADTLTRLERLNEFRIGTNETLDHVLQQDPELQAVVQPETDTSFADLNRMERLLTDRLALLNEQYEYLQVPMDMFLKQDAELNHTVEKIKETLRRVKLSVLLWGRLHRMMSAGITDPAKIDIFGLMKSAVNKAI